MPYSKLWMQIYKDLHTNLKNVEMWYSYSYNQTTATMQSISIDKLYPKRKTVSNQALS